MSQYILKLTYGVAYRLYSGTTAVSDTDLTALFATAGSAYFSFDFDGGTPSSTDSLQIIDGTDSAILSNNGLSDAIVENKNYKGTWLTSATTFDSFSELSGKSLDESQVSFLMKEIKGNTSTLEDAAYIGSVLSTPSTTPYVGTGEIVDGAVTVAKLAPSTFYDVLYDGTAVTGDVALSANPTQYTRLKIYGVTSDGRSFSYEVYSPTNGGEFDITCFNMNSTPDGWIKNGKYTIDATNNKLVKGTTGSGQYDVAANSWNVDVSYIRIRRVEGWKF